MANKKLNTIDPRDLNGISIYHEEKRTVYSPRFSKKGYIITKDNARQYQSYIQGYLIALLVFSLAYIIYRNFWMALLLAAIFIASTIGTFYFTFIRNANFIDNYNKPQRDTFAVRQASYLSDKQLWTIIICCPLLALAIMYNAHLRGYTGSSYYLMAFISFIAILYGILHIYILYYKKKNIDK